jgi:hypothetical protein
MRGDGRQQPLFDVRRFEPDPYPVGSFYDTLERYGELIIRREDFPVADPEAGGEEPWCPVLKSKLVLIQRYHGWDDRETVQRAKTDLQVKACLGLGLSDGAPSQPTLVRHRQLMKDLGLHEVYMQRFVDLIKALELVEKDEPVAVDTVPIVGAGQVLDTFNLLGAGIRKGLLQLAKVRGQPAEQVATELGLSDYLERSIKGTANIDWHKVEERREFLAKLIQDARRLQEAMWQPARRRSAKTLQERGEEEPDDDEGSDEPQSGGVSDAGPSDEGIQSISECLDKIIEHDVEVNAQDEVVGIRQVAGEDRLISITDPEMRHGRKTASFLFSGFKAQIVAAVTYGWILLVKVIAANRHDGHDLPQIIEQVEEEHALHPRAYIGDHAYGILDNHRFIELRNARGDKAPIELIARNARPTNRGCFTKDEFDLDFDKRILTCPAGHQCSSKFVTCEGQRAWLFEFPWEICEACPLRAQCMQRGKKKDRKNKLPSGRSVTLVPETERLIRQHLQRRQEPDFIELLSKRQVVERANAGFAQCGGKVAQRFGQQDVEFDATLSALGYNLRTLGSLAVRNSHVRKRLEQRIADNSRAAILFFFLFFRPNWCLWRLLSAAAVVQGLMQDSRIRRLHRYNRPRVGAAIPGPASESSS